MALTKEESIRLVKRQISVQLRDATHRHLLYDARHTRTNCSRKAYADSTSIFG